MVKEIILDIKNSVALHPKSPYNFNATVFKPSHYPDNTKVHETGKYWMGLRFKNKIYGIKMENIGTTKKPSIKLTIFSNRQLSKNEIEEIVKEIDFRFEFNRDISEFFNKFKNDKILSPFLKKWNGMHGSCAQDLYGLLMIGIFLQNTIVKRTVQMTNIMLEKYGRKLLFDKREVYIFWKPEEIIKVSEEELRNLKVGYRAKLFLKLSYTFVKEKIDEFKLREMPKEEAKKELIKLYGVGPETARILLQEALHHYDLFEHVAPWQQKILSRLLFNKESVSVEKIIDYVNSKWGGWSSLAVHYIWEDIFWQRKKGNKIEWLDKEIRL